MRKDPIVEEVRNAGNSLAAQAGNDLHEFCERLRKAQSQDAQRLVRREPKRNLKSGSKSGG